ncbi:MAG: FmdB family zinc ribbon protein [Microthrixaceae bacterium]
MPLYDYRCRECGHEFEIQQSISEDALTECPECSGDLRKVFSPVGISFKGSGFYKNDSRGSSGNKAGGSKSSGESGTSDASKGSGSSEGSGSGGDVNKSDGSKKSADSTSSSGSSAADS